MVRATLLFPFPPQSASLSFGLLWELCLHSRKCGVRVCVCVCALQVLLQGGGVGGQWRPP